MLILTRKLNESINIGDNVEVSVIEIKGDQVKLGISAPREIKVYRKEVYLAIQRENEEASRTPIELPVLGNLIENDSSNSDGD
jgi:carbon storage regulator